MLDSTETGRTELRDDLDADVASTPFLGQWNRLISTTNWEKGRIIYEWRESLFLSGAAPQDYADDAWSRRVGNVTGQHVGRLRRVFERYGQTRETYAGLFWSHFQATLDWNDAEMWLEGAVQNDWSVAQMRDQRWQAMGSPEDKRPKAEDVVVSELDEDAAWDQKGKERSLGVTDEIRDPADSDAPFDESEASHSESDFGDESATNSAERVTPISPFAEVGELPDDLADAVESMKLAIVRHKLAGWRDVSAEMVLGALNALRVIAMSEVSAD
ncbi:MAG: hypothetical protein SGJ19_07320 [Planctomycetia bacterium]|nr:hypothetical protein [Planctomycetia bacterium]